MKPRSIRPLALPAAIGLLLSLAIARIADERAGIAERPATAPASRRADAYADATADARRLAARILDLTGAPALAAAVAVDGETVWSEAFGWADVARRVPATRTTRFRIGSVSKPLTAAAVALLFEAGRLDLDAPVQRWVPSFPDKGHAITTRQLAGHLAGIRHYRGDEFRSRKRYASVVEGLEIFRDDPLLAPPGTRYAYSSYGWNLISAVVEGASGKPFLETMQATVFDPLRMTRTAADRTDVDVPDRATFYEPDGAGGMIEAPFVDNSHKWAGGGFLSTPDDLVRFGNAHLDPGFLRAETLDLLFTSQKTDAGEETGYGIGWSTSRSGEWGRLVAHSGGSVGGSAYLGVLRDSRVVVAVALNVPMRSRGDERPPAPIEIARRFAAARKERGGIR